MTRDKNHPVWEVYDMFRTSALNVKYFSCRLSETQNQNFWMELILAVTASSSAIAAFALWKTPLGGTIWMILGGVSAIIAVIKPLLKLTDKIRKIEEVVTGYRVLEHDLKKIQVAIRQRGVYDKELSDRFLSLLDRMDQLVIQYNDLKEDEKLKKVCQDQVNKEFPSTSFFIPEK